METEINPTGFLSEEKADCQRKIPQSSVELFKTRKQ